MAVRQRPFLGPQLLTEMWRRQSRRTIRIKRSPSRVSTCWLRSRRIMAKTSAAWCHTVPCPNPRPSRWNLLLNVRFQPDHSNNQKPLIQMLLCLTFPAAIAENCFSESCLYWSWPVMCLHSMPDISNGHQANYPEALQCCLDQKHKIRVNEVIIESADQCWICPRLQ